MANHVVKGATRGRNVQGASPRSSYSRSSGGCFTSSTMVRLLIAYDSCNWILQTGQTLFAQDTTKAMDTFAVFSIPSILSCYNEYALPNPIHQTLLLSPPYEVKWQIKIQIQLQIQIQVQEVRKPHPSIFSRKIPLFHHLNYPVQWNPPFMYFSLTTTSQLSTLCLPPKRETMPREGHTR
jgi:hypothetical protein